MSKALNYLKGGLLSLAVSFVLILVLACFVQLFSLNSVVITTINQIIKIIAIFFGLKLTKIDRKGAVCGGVFGAVYSVITNALLCLICFENFALKGILLDICYSALVGAILGVICVNAKSKN